MTPSAPTSTTNSDSSSGRNWVAWVARYRELSIVFFILILAVVVGLRAPVFLSAANFRDILMTISILLICALGQTMVIITGGIDLSISAVIGLTAMMVAATVAVVPGFPIWAAPLLGMALGAVLGAVNGVVIAWGNVPPIIMTLGTLSIYRGLVFFYSQGDYVNAFEMPAGFKLLAKGTLFGIPNLILIAVAVAIIVWYFLNYTRTGRDIYAVGGNKEAAAVAGIRVQRTLFLVYLLSGLLAGLAGVLWAARVESAQTNTALGFELQTVAASVVGGVNILGGSGTVAGVALGALLLGMINNALTLVKINPFIQIALQGALILTAVLVDSAISKRMKRAAIT